MSNANHLLTKWTSIMDALNLYVEDVKEQAIQQERETCAKIAQDYFIQYDDCEEGCARIAKSIRERK